MNTIAGVFSAISLKAYTLLFLVLCDFKIHRMILNEIVFYYTIYGMFKL